MFVSFYYLKWVKSEFIVLLCGGSEWTFGGWLRQ